MHKLKNVLLIDDDDAVNFINSIVIERAGITDHIEVAINGKQALEFLQRHDDFEKEYEINNHLPTLILLDINMPIMDGWDFVEAYRQLELDKKENCTIVMLTTSINPDDKIRAESIKEIAGFQVKPLNKEGINAIISEYFS